MAAQTQTDKPQSLGKFTVTPSDGVFHMRIETEEGAVLDLTATRDQIDILADALDDMLAETEEDDAVED
ncbi:hypothetical protein GCM10007036_12030 [Alsobacter metallidurans]|uniref:Uncharacterized protein n=1 Tax=Alsobacter metallidurans TaxID=340221 RepID=A0A917MG89_9HYPH|nr:hypothetical protein [Alsobacter metallidurans]GGH13438.1 hypothetical protein GCM10007036_12030 [Alsobacter metallidurans]